MRERIYKAMVSRYHSNMEDALLKVDLLLVNASSNSVMVDHTDITGEIDKLLAQVATAQGKLDILKKYYSSN
jgi:peptidoglycan hydrolase CwlO-like protein